MSTQPLGRGMAVLCVVIAASLWGTLGIAYELVQRHVDIDRLTLVTLRALGATLVLATWFGLRDRTVFRIRQRDLPRFLILGLVAVTAFYVLLIYTFQYASVAVGSLLLYTAPAMVTVASVFLLGEALTGPKVAALFSSLIGCGLVVEIASPGALSGNWKGIALGLASALCYACYALVAKPLLARYRASTVQVTHMLIGALALLVVKLVNDVDGWPPLWQALLIAAFLGTVICIAPTALFMTGLSALPSSEASILATMEPVVAMVLATLVLDERLSEMQVAGAVFVIAAVVILARAGARRPRSIAAQP